MTFSPGDLKGGSLELEDESTHVATLWYVPGGWDLTQAQPVNVFFSSVSAAEAFTDLYKQPPSMASMEAITRDGLVVNRYQRIFGDS